MDGTGAGRGAGRQVFAASTGGTVTMDGNQAFEILDPRLNVFALANGTDLLKEPGERRLVWYRDGLERGVLIRAASDGTVATIALAWKRGDAGSERSAPHRDGLDAAELAQHLSAILDEAVNQANAL